MPENKIGLDEFLKTQGSSFEATVEPVEDAPDLVKVSPYVRGLGCLCQLAVKLPGTTIESVEPTSQTHHCCGKILTVVKVNFKAESTITLNDLFSQLSASAGSHAHKAPVRGTGMSSMGYGGVLGAGSPTARPGSLPVGSPVSLYGDCLSNPTFSSVCVSECMGRNDYTGMWYCIPSICCGE
ncbi:MAG: hypothetical protein JOZ57_09590 [Abitibacteriaceae bacterium]|nr:hypothetical protein [Abditibacteriaceae bacterium]